MLFVGARGTPSSCSRTVFAGERLVFILKSALSLTLSLKGEGTVGQTRMFWS